MLSFPTIFRKIQRWFSNLVRDVLFLSRMVPALLQIKGIVKQNDKNGAWSILAWWQEIVQKHATQTALILEEQSLTFGQVDQISNQYARMAKAAFDQIHPGETVALCMENCPAYICWVLALAKLGVSVALLNTNVKGEGLRHCVASCGATFILYSKEFRGVINEAYPNKKNSDEENTVALQCIDDMDGTTVSSAAMPPGLIHDVKFSDTVLHIFTSGTTGLPKAAKISHLRYYGSSLIFSNLLQLKADDVLYCPLPLYHSSAIVLGLGLCFHNGIPFVMTQKFSVRNFWSVCVQHEVTIVQYIGELCRYLTSAPFSPDENYHTVRIAIGNGLSRDVWVPFQERFEIPKIMEFYSATEANVGLVNPTGKVGACGILSSLLAKKHPGKLLKFDYETGQPYRDPNNGLCVECPFGEIGEFVGMINATDPTQKFDGYSDANESQKKILSNVLKQGDKCFRSGDLMKRDEDGYVYFVDRIGDTIRWKGENISTTEVESVIQTCCNEDENNTRIQECVVHGVSVPGYEGKAGMALLKTASAGDSNNRLLLESIQIALVDKLPEYARPVFLRFTTQTIDTTATFKYRKQGCEGFDPAALAAKECIFVRTKGDDETFVEMTESVYRGILDGTIRL